MIDLFPSATMKDLIERGLILICEDRKELGRVKLRRMHCAEAIFLKTKTSKLKTIKDRIKGCTLYATTIR